MNFLKTFLILLIASVVAFAKTGYAASFDLTLDAPYTQAVEDLSAFGELSDNVSFKQSHQPIDKPFLVIDLEDEEEEDSSKKKRCPQILNGSTKFEETPNFTPLSLGGTTKFKGISEIQSIRLHLILEKFQI